MNFKNRTTGQKNNTYKKNDYRSTFRCIFITIKHFRTRRESIKTWNHQPAKKPKPRKNKLNTKGTESRMIQWLLDTHQLEKPRLYLTRIIIKSPRNLLRTLRQLHTEDRIDNATETPKPQITQLAIMRSRYRPAAERTSQQITRRTREQ